MAYSDARPSLFTTCVQGLMGLFTMTPPSHDPLPLSQLPSGSRVQITAIQDDYVATLALQFGLNVGDIIEIQAKSPGGPLVLLLGQTEIALGRSYCHCIIGIPMA